jgi:uncharacterized lipoprotein YajG
MLKPAATKEKPMSKKLKTLSEIGALLSLLWLAACASQVPTSTPTLDLNPVRTEVAATVLAQVTQALMRTPSVTPLPSPTATLPSTSTPTQVASPSSTVASTLSVTTPVTGTENLAQWVSQTVADNTIFTPSQTFTMTWTLKNVGNSTWTAGYMLRYYSGDTFNAPKEIPLGREVLPGGTVDIVIHMRAPAKIGSYRSDWVMSTENRSNFKEPVYLKITVAVPLTPTPTPKS